MNIKQIISNNEGFSTLEMLIAMFILVLTLTAVVGVSFGNQSMIVNSRTSAEALNIAQGLLEKAQADARRDFNLVNPVAEAVTDGDFITRVDVTQTDYFTKLVTATVDFPQDSGRRGKTSLSTLVTNFNNANGGDTCSSILLPNAQTWQDLKIMRTFFDFSSLTGMPGSYPVTDIDAYKGKLYVTVGKTATSTVPTFFIFDADSLTRITQVDNDPNNKTGLNAVAVAENPASGTTYAYVANASSINKSFQVIDVGSSPPAVKASLSVGGHAHGNSIFYKNGYVYLGLESSASGPEFSIIDVHNPLAPSEVGHWPASGHLGHTINAINVQGRYAYLAVANTDNHEKLIILDVSDASAPFQVGSLGDSDDNNGKAMAIAGDILYLGRTEAIANDGAKFCVLDISDPATSTPPVIGLLPEIDASVDSVIVRQRSEPGNSADFPVLAFLLTPSAFRVFDVSDPNTIAEWASLPLDSGTFGSSTYEPVADCEGNNFFIASNDGGDGGHISIIGPGL